MELLDECLSVEISDNEINIIALDVVRCMGVEKTSFSSVSADSVGA